MNLDVLDLDLGQLFALADEIGCQYQGEEEIEEFTNLLLAVHEEAADEGLLDG